MRVVEYRDIDRAEWSRLVQSSATGTWFQTPEAYSLYASMPDLFRPFAIAVERVNELTNEGTLCGVCVGYVTVEKSAVKQFFTRRAIIIGGPALADDCTDAEVLALMEGVKTKTRHFQSLDSDLPETTHQSACMQASRQPENLSRVADEQQNASQKHAALTKNIKNTLRKLSPIYIETRNFNDYSKWRGAFEAAGFAYQPHLNFHVDTSSMEVVETNLGKSRKRDIKTSIRDGAVIIDISNAGLQISDSEKERMVHAYYLILKNLYETKVKTPLFPESFFQALAKHPDGRFLLVGLPKEDGSTEIIGGTVCVVFDKNKSAIINHKSEITTTPSGVMYEWFVCGRDGEWKSIFPSSVATYAGIKYAAEHGCARFDMMGAGTPDEAYGVRDFKARFGGAEVEHGRFLCITKPLLYRIGKLGVSLLKKLK